jgi:hypothetical protein
MNICCLFTGVPSFLSLAIQSLVLSSRPLRLNRTIQFPLSCKSFLFGHFLVEKFRSYFFLLIEKKKFAKKILGRRKLTETISNNSGFQFVGFFGDFGCKQRCFTVY